MKLVSGYKRIELSRDFDASTKVRFWKCLNEQHEKFVALQTGRAGRDSFADHMAGTISAFQDGEDGAVFYDPTSEDNMLDLGSIAAKTFYNFLSNDQPGILKTHPRTLRYVEAYLEAAEGMAAHNFRRDTFLETLGATTSVQYASPKRLYPARWFENFGSKNCLYKYDARASMVPGPLQAAEILIHVQAVPTEHFFIFRVVPLPSKLEQSRFAETGPDLSDWSEEHYAGIGAPTRDGLSCHLTSANAKIPLYLLIRPKESGHVEIGFVSYEAPGYLLPYMEAKPLERPDIVDYFDNQPWII